MARAMGGRARRRRSRRRRAVALGGEREWGGREVVVGLELLLVALEGALGGSILLIRVGVVLGRLGMRMLGRDEAVSGL